MKNTANRDALGNVVKNLEAILYYNKKMVSDDNIDQQWYCIQVLGKNFN